MKKNVASQVIGCQMITAADGSAFTGSVTVYVTGDGGSQAIGSVGSGICTHEGNGYHTYLPSQAETNYDLVAFTFIGTGAIPATIQIYTSYPQTGDSYGRIGAAGGNSPTQTLTQDIANLWADTNDIQSNLTTVAGYIDTEVAAIKAKTDNLPASPAATSDIPTAAQVADKILGRSLAGSADGGRTVKDALRSLRNKTSISGGTLTVCEEDDSTPAWTAAVTTTPGDPLSAIDPA